MSDYPNPNIHRSDGLSVRGLFITLGVILFIFVVLAALGAGTSGDGTPRATVPDSATPAGTTPEVAPEAAPVVPITE